VTTTSDLGLDPDEGLETPVARRAAPPSLRPAVVVSHMRGRTVGGGFAVALIGSGQSGSIDCHGLATPVPGVNLSAVNA